MAELNDRLAAADAAGHTRHIDGRASTVGADFAIEQPSLLALPADRFDTARSLSTRVDRYSWVTVGQCYYSVTAGLIGELVRCRCGRRPAHFRPLHAGGHALETARP